MHHIIAGGVSGAITDTGSEEAKAHASLFYEEVRHRTGDIQKIASNTGFSVGQILLIKQYLFLDEHVLDDGEPPRRFDPCLEIAHSWQRLSGKISDIKEHDILLLQHELEEIRLINEGKSQDEAHVLASEKYNYTEASDDFYHSLMVATSGQGAISGGITRLTHRTH